MAAVYCIYNCGASFNTAAAMAIHLSQCPNRSKNLPKPGKTVKRPKDKE